VTATADQPAASAATPADDRSAVYVPRPSALWLLIGGVLGLAASLTLTVEKIALLIDPAYVPTCSLNPVLACGSVMVSWQASVFGFPNPLIGIVAFTVVTVTGVISVGGVRLPRWYWSGLAMGSLLGTIFVHWLIFQSLYRIGALCPYCMVVWSVTIPTFVVATAITLRPLGAHPAARLLYQWRWSLVTFWFVGVVLLALVRFWDYWSTLI